MYKVATLVSNQTLQTIPEVGTQDSRLIPKDPEPVLPPEESEQTGEDFFVCFELNLWGFPGLRVRTKKWAFDHFVKRKRKKLSIYFCFNVLESGLYL